MALKNKSIVDVSNRSLDTRSIFVCEVKAIEGDPSWEIYRKELNGDNPDQLMLNRTVDKGTGRIIFKLIEQDDLKLANPLLSRVYNIFPKPGEYVKVIAYDIVDNDLCFDYIGPIIPSLINTNNSVDAIGKRNNDAFGNFNNDEPIIDFQGTNNDIKKIYPTTNDIAIQGRGSSQILIRKIEPDPSKPNEYTIIRAGMYKTVVNDNVPTYNPQEAFIKVTIEPDPKIGEESTTKEKNDTNFIQHIYQPKYDSNAITTPPGTTDIKTRVDIVGEKINLFTYPDYRTEAYSIPYAELLYQYLGNLQKWLMNHVHGIDGTVAQDPAQKLGNNLSITDKGFISIPGKGSKLGLTKDIKII